MARCIKCGAFLRGDYDRVCMACDNEEPDEDYDPDFDYGIFDEEDDEDFEDDSWGDENY